MSAVLGFLRAVLLPFLVELLTKALSGAFAARKESTTVTLGREEVVTQRPGAVVAPPTKPVAGPVVRPPASSWAGWAPRSIGILILVVTLGGCANRTVETVRVEERIARELRILDNGEALPGGGALVADEDLVRVAIMEADGSFAGEVERSLNGHVVVPRGAWIEALATRRAWAELVETLPRRVPEGSEGPSPHEYAVGLLEQARSAMRR